MAEHAMPIHGEPARAPSPGLRQVLSAFAELLSYPSERIADAADVVDAPGWFRRASLEEQQELYGATFDLQPACAPYFAHHLLGEESPLRGPLLARLAGIYAANGYHAREELPDHVAEVLRFLATAPASAERDDLVRDGLLPALRTMIESFADQENPYREVLVALEALLARCAELATPHASPAAPQSERRSAP